MKSHRHLRAFLILAACCLAPETSPAQNEPQPYSGDFMLAAGTTPADMNMAAPQVAVSEAMTGQVHPGLYSTTSPLSALNSYLDGFHFMSGDMEQQMETHHYCSKLNEDLTQCVLYDGNSPQAKLIGVEYIVNRKTFESLPDSEKHLWHSHVYEVKSGELMAPGVPRAAEHALMRDLIDTYGKTWHTWQAHRADNALPTGVPALMMAFTADGQVKQELITRRDRALGSDTVEARSDRADIVSPQVANGADVWRQGAALQVRVMDSSVKKVEGHAVLLP